MRIHTAVGLSCFLLAFGAARAVPTIGVDPASIAVDDARSVTIDIGNVAGGEAILRLYLDANGNGVIDAPTDIPIFADRIADDVPDYAPTMFSDTDPAAGSLTVAVREFGPFGFPYTAGSFVWEVEDVADNSTQTAAFTITPLASSQSVSGTVRDADTSMPVAGAFVLLLPFCEQGDEALRVYSTVADGAGAYSIPVPTEVACRGRVVIAARPGWITSFFGNPSVELDGSTAFSGLDPELVAGDHAVSGRIEYADGPLAGTGVPGVAVFAESGSPGLSFAFADENGDYVFVLDDGEWSIASPEDNIASRGVVEREDETVVVVAGGPAAAATLSMTAANAFFEGTLLDDTLTPVAGHPIRGNRSDACGADCYAASTVTRPDGSYVLGVVGPAGPATHEYVLGVDEPLVGLIGEQIGCETISAGETLAGRDVRHYAPTSFVRGSVVDVDGDPLGGICVEARSFSSCSTLVSAAVSTCDGRYELPVLDGNWFGEISPDDTASIYGGLSPDRIEFDWTVAGGDLDGESAIVGPWRTNPRIVAVDPIALEPGAQLLIRGYGFSAAGTPPEVRFGATLASNVAFLPDRGFLIVEVPLGLSAGSHDVTVRNVDLDVTSPPACVEVLGGVHTPACTISGTIDDAGGAVAGATVVALDDGDFVRVATTDGSGNYAIGLETPGTYGVLVFPPTGAVQVDAELSVDCGLTLDHTLVPGNLLEGQIVDAGLEGAGSVSVFVGESGGGSYDTNRVTDADGNFAAVVPDGTFSVAVVGPPDARFLQGNVFGPQAIASDTNVGPLVAATGPIVAGNVVDPTGTGVAADVTAVRQSDSVPVRSVRTDTCSGRFHLPLPEETYELELEPIDAGSLQAARVDAVTLGADEPGEFDFVLREPSLLPSDAALPRIQFVEPAFRLQRGQPLVLTAPNVGGTVVEVRFDDGAGGSVAGDDTRVDAARGLVLTRVPVGAAGGSMWIRVDGVDGPPAPLTLLPGTFDPGAFTVGGTVSGPGSAGALVAVLGVAGAGCGTDGITVLDYGLTGGGGAYGPLSQPGGEIGVIVIPTIASTAVQALEQRTGVAGNLTIDPTLVAGTPVSIRVLDPSMAPVEGVTLYGEPLAGGLEDSAMTDANGDATVWVAPGDYLFGAIPPPGTRLLEAEAEITVAAPFDFGDTPLSSGVFASSAIRRDDTFAPFGGARIGADGLFPPFPFLGDTYSGIDGGFGLAVAPDSPVRLTVEVADDELVGTSVDLTTDPVVDSIVYPALTLASAGRVDGLVRDADTLAPLPDIDVLAFDGMSVTGFGRTCADGTYSVKVEAGAPTLRFLDSVAGLYAETWFPDARCEIDATPVAVVAGNTVTADVDMPRNGSISGTVRQEGVPLAGATVCITSTSLPCIVACDGPTPGDGSYSLTLPPAGDYRVEATAAMVAPQCWDGIDGCATFTPVAVVAAVDTPGIDFDFPAPCDPIDDDFDGFSECAGDCDDAVGATYPGAPETNDGLDNQCPGDAGFGSVDEIAPTTGFLTPGDPTTYQWPAQPSATLYEVARSTSPDFVDAATTFETAGTSWTDPTLPTPGQTLHYLVRPLAPFVGSWGRDSLGAERTVNVLPNGDLEDWSGPSNAAVWEESAAGGTIERETDPAEIVRGQSAARLTRTGAGGVILFQRDLPLVPGRTYTLSLKAKASAALADGLQVRLANFTTGDDLQGNGTWGGFNFFDVAVTTGYQTITLGFTVDPGFAPTDELRLILRQNTTTPVGTVLRIDDVRIEE